jgi:hypothetical protein
MEGRTIGTSRNSEAGGGGSVEDFWEMMSDMHFCLIYQLLNYNWLKQILLFNCIPSIKPFRLMCIHRSASKQYSISNFSYPSSASISLVMKAALTSEPR